MRREHCWQVWDAQNSGLGLSAEAGLRLRSAWCRGPPHCWCDEATCTHDTCASTRPGTWGGRGQGAEGEERRRWWRRWDQNVGVQSPGHGTGPATCAHSPGPGLRGYGGRTPAWGTLGDGPPRGQPAPLPCPPGLLCDSGRDRTGRQGRGPSPTLLPSGGACAHGSPNPERVGSAARPAGAPGPPLLAPGSLRNWTVSDEPQPDYS